jgi:hypothetical protein
MDRSGACRRTYGNADISLESVFVRRGGLLDKLLGFSGNLRGSLLQKGIEVIREKGLRQVVPVAGGMAFLAIRTGTEAAHRNSERFDFHLADQLPPIPVRKPDIADQHIEAGGRDRIESGGHVVHGADLMPDLLKVPRQVGQGVFVVFNKKNSQAK